MSINTDGAAQVSLTVFGGLCTESAAVDLPEGVSPDNQDVEYLPGSVFSRRALAKVFAAPFGTATVTYSKSFVMPTGDIRNIYLDSNGNFWWEDVTNTPGVYTALGLTVQSGAFAKSITAFGREYIAVSDLLHGADIPLQWDGTFLDRVTQDGPGTPPTIANLQQPGVALAAVGGHTLVRAGNIVTANTAAAHNLQVGYQALIAGAIPPLVVGGGVASIVINNEELPGIATVLMNSAHGLKPGTSVIINGVAAVAIGGGISSVTWAGGVATVTTTTPHGLSPGSLVTIASSGGNAGYDLTTPVLSVASANVFTYALTPLVAPTATGGAVTLNWPVPDGTPTPTYFEVVACPTSTTFQVAVSYADGTWTTGAVSFPWEGTFFVASVTSSTAFTYQQYGPDGTTATVGTATPWGQAAPGLHQLQVLFLTRQGYLTRPSPPVTFEANGGQYLNVTNIPIGPANVVARVLAFTGAGGAYFFYIPTPPQENGQVVGTPTQINDNTATSIVLDFSDNTLFSALGISVPGNTPANQIVIDGALGFGLYASRLITWGQRSCIQNLLNMGFSGGYAPATPAVPTGWQLAAGSAGGQLVADPGRLNMDVWEIFTNIGNGALQQSMYEDAYGAPIAQPNTQYSFRCWIGSTGNPFGGPALTAIISSVSTGFSATAVIHPIGGGASSFVQANFSALTPAAIPPDLVLKISATTPAVGVFLIRDMSVIYAANPFLDTIMYQSYVDNPEAFDGVSGKLGSSQDTHKIMDMSDIRQSGYFLTQDPGGRLHQFNDNGTTEPAGWPVAEVAANCGLLSAFALTKSQADDSSAAGGEEWFAWASATGARIFGGDQPYKISQEIQPDWDSISTASPLAGYYANTPAPLTAWILNDPDIKLLLFGLPIKVVGTEITNPNRIYAMSYRELDTAFQIATSGPIHTSFTGRLIATDHTRKWTRWNMTMNGAALMYRTPNPNPLGVGTVALPIVLFGGNGAPPGTLAGFGNVYTLDPNRFTDDDYGLIQPYYTTYFFVGHDQEVQLSYQLPNGQRVPLGAGRKQLQYLTAFIGAPGNLGTSVLTLAFLCNSLTNVWPLDVVRNLVPNPKIDLECGGGGAIGNRIAIKIASAPLNSTLNNDNGFVLQHLTAWLKAATHLPIRGAQ